MNYSSAIKSVITIFILMLILHNLDWQSFYRELEAIDILPAAIALFFISLQILFLNIRWHYLLKKHNANVKFETSSVINIAGYLANIIFITSIGGIVTKSGLAIRQGLSLSEAIFATILDRIMTMIALLVFCTIGLSFLYTFLGANFLKVLMVFAICGFISVLTMVLFFKKEWPAPFHRLQAQKHKIFNLVATFYLDKRLVINLVLLSIIAQACFIFSVYVLSINANVLDKNNIPEFLALLPFLILISSLPISLGGWGVREGAFVYGLGLIGFSFESAFLLSIQIGVITMVAPLLVGVPYFLKSDLRDLLFADKAFSSKYET